MASFSRTFRKNDVIGFLQSEGGIYPVFSSLAMIGTVVQCNYVKQHVCITALKQKSTVEGTWPMVVSFIGQCPGSRTRD